MDAMVLAAMAKWPDVPAVYGFLALDARGRWWLKGERVANAALTGFLARNYAIDAAGRAYVQNGPQQVFVACACAPRVIRREAGLWRAEPDGATGSVDALWLTPDGELYAAFAGSLALVDDRELVSLADEILPGWNGDEATLPAAVELDGQRVPLACCAADALAVRFALQLTPRGP
ncbi:DUF2946 family protein [Crenobacter caeni]|uniref:DUF2946 family protein n=1 Tax=Crenobacter caeni TaxID=2705474 RepID=A0A6B2KNL4_9NEIS|nr:DUF2946 family protein [Crenobacter caeni]NDV11770.1 DUF2946 family protein [Crenobacter caeni]